MLTGADGERVRGRIESGRWYDIRVELSGPQIKCYLDGQLVQQAVRGQSEKIFAVAGRDAASGDVILKIVNTGSQPREAILELGAFAPATGHATVLTSGSLEDVNSFRQPRNIAPREEPFACSGDGVRRTLAPNSFTVLRLKPAK